MLECYDVLFSGACSHTNRGQATERHTFTACQELLQLLDWTVFHILWRSAWQLDTKRLLISVSANTVDKHEILQQTVEPGSLDKQDDDVSELVCRYTCEDGLSAGLRSDGIHTCCNDMRSDTTAD